MALRIETEEISRLYSFITGAGTSKYSVLFASSILLSTMKSLKKTALVILPFSKWEKNVTRQPRADTGSYFCVCDIAQKGDYMQLRFNDGTTLAIQKATELGGGLQVLVAGTTPEELRKLFTDPIKTAKMTVTERGQVLGEYENYTEFYRTEEYTGKIYGIVVNKVGESAEERLASAEQTIAQTNIDMKMAIAELTMVIASTQGGGAGV
ncbi:MAG: hypothetical protein U0N87_00775, partial [Anaerobutyricum sp.]